MPTINLPIPLSGPLIMVLVGVSFPRQQALLDAGQPVPPLATGTFLIDTGASSTCVDPDLLEGLNLTATGIVGISTPSTAGNPHLCEQYDVSLFLPGNQVGGHLIQALPVITTHLKTQGIDGLLGRDVLNACTLIYNGSLATCSLAY